MMIMAMRRRMMVVMVVMVIMMIMMILSMKLRQKAFVTKK
jgi:hypothetical protein